MPQDDPLIGLRALHLPPAPSSFWSDLAFAAAAGLALALLASLLVRTFARPKTSLKTGALAALTEANALPPPERRAAQAAILRRVVRSKEGDAAAQTQGEAWAATLDRVFATDLFSKRSGRVFAGGLYAAPTADDPALDGELATLFSRLGR